MKEKRFALEWFELLPNKKQLQKKSIGKQISEKNKNRPSR